MKHTTDIALLLIIVAIITLNLFGIIVLEPLNNISLMVVSAFFGANIPKSKD